ncbi:hypothetical protein CLPU_3c02220 [Gottschalkia purinilytica]|uniref:DUF2344 domain-containing protein n=1 Tax=Gottschalkia purinilytica TaxID=1503 RepID=A0A0L0WD95_GOTPU|nr:TIGR03936 family radical SAM-associated protein [Gottschalkia purinilytica]KNF09443.1 hypothetical protein CLPU_3c02220 [Gottschalkia purinilytica]
MTNIRAKFTKCNDLKYISHLDLMRLFQRAFRRADIPLKYSEGFNPQPKMAFATALSLGVSSDGEYMDIELEDNIDIKEFVDRTNSVLPDGIKIVKASDKDTKESIMALIRWSEYIVEVSLIEKIDKETIDNEINKFMKMEEIIVVKEKKKGYKVVRKEDNVRDRIRKLIILDYEDNTIIFKMMLKTGSNGNLKPEVVIDKLDELTKIKIDKENIKIHRLDLFIEKEDHIVTPI